jgi:hypothetical protein
MLAGEVPYILASSIPGTDLPMARISKTCSGVNRAFHWRSPRTVDSGLVYLPFLEPMQAICRPFLSRSALLSALVPRNRCLGLTQRRTSQWWSTQRPSGIGPYSISHATRWAPSVRGRRRNSPYPHPKTPAVQSQHSSSLPIWTFERNRSMSLGDSSGVIIADLATCVP